ncbi:hypothetical protein HDU96_002481 [Phlyctochytrium bullatum]|nr:hypothetical protein HDU96_002481 [Phlyctochytrium bullatum]
MFKKGTPKDQIDEAIKQVETSGGTIGHRYESTILGFSAALPDNLLSKFLRSHPPFDGTFALLFHLDHASGSDFTSPLPTATFQTNPHIEVIEADGEVSAFAKSKGI